MQIAAVVRVEELSAAFVTGRDVGGDEDIAALLGAFDDGKARVGLGSVETLRVELQDGGALRRLALDGGQERVDSLLAALGENLDIWALVADAAEDMEARGQPVDEGTEADTLDDAVYFAMEKRHRLATFRRGFILSIIIAVFLASCYMDGGEIRGCWESP